MVLQKQNLIEGPDPNTCQIKLNRGLVCIFDRADLELVSQYKWKAVKSHRFYYAVAKVRDKGKVRYIRMHRLLTNCPAHQIVHHCNRRPMDNRQINLQIMDRDDHRHLCIRIF